MSIIDTYNNNSRKLFSNIGNRNAPIGLIEQARSESDYNKPALLTLYNPLQLSTFNPTSLVSTYMEYDYDHNYNKSSILNTYNSNQGYTSFAATLGSYALGNTQPTDVVKSLLGFGVTNNQSTISGILLGVGNNLLRNSGIEDTINDIFASPFSSNNTGVLTQLYYNKILLQNRPPTFSASQRPLNDLSSYNLFGDIANTTLNTLIGGGTLNLYNLNDGVNKGLSEFSKQDMAARGEKYTQGLARTHSYSTYINNDPTLLQNALLYSNYLPSLYFSDRMYSNVVNNYDDEASPIYVNYKQSIYQQIKDSIQQRISANENGYANQELSFGFIWEGGNSSPSSTSYETARGVSNAKYIHDAINMLDVGEESTEYKDYVRFKIEDVSSGTPIPLVFRSIISNITDDPSPSWSSNKYVGNAQSSYIYEGWERKITLSLRVVVTAEAELQTVWNKLNHLYGLAYPSQYVNDSVLIAPLVKLTLGDLYDGLSCHINTISYNISNEFTWDTTEGQQLPMIIDVSLGFTVMHEGTSLPITSSPHFGYLAEA